MSTKLEGIHRLFSLSVLTSFLSQCAMYAVLVFAVALIWLASDVGTWRYWFGLLRDQLLGFLFGYRPLLVVIDYRGSNGNYDDSVLLVDTVFLCRLISFKWGTPKKNYGLCGRRDSKLIREADYEVWVPRFDTRPGQIFVWIKWTFAQGSCIFHMYVCLGKSG